jgi:hypothetical protein
MWDRVKLLHEYHGDVPVELRILKLTEEVGELRRRSSVSAGSMFARAYAALARIFWMNSPMSSSRRRWP